MRSISYNRAPKYLLLELDDEIPAFEQVVCGITLPTVDMDACLSQIFDVVVITNNTDFTKMLANVALFMGEGEGLYSNARLDEYEIRQITEAIIRVGNSLRERITLLNLCIDGFIPYSFKRLIGKNLVVLCINECN
ncbi:MAG: hypothetical protein ACD_84C00035G0001 [uncultured bacterium]|nr:MAG: hypothetical protein ACD_84C00035G0001 [uncultured bacterium]